MYSGHHISLPDLPEGLINPNGFRIGFHPDTIDFVKNRRSDILSEHSVDAGAIKSVTYRVPGTVQEDVPRPMWLPRMREFLLKHQLVDRNMASCLEKCGRSNDDYAYDPSSENASEQFVCMLKCERVAILKHVACAVEAVKGYESMAQLYDERVQIAPLSDENEISFYDPKLLYREVDYDGTEINPFLGDSFDIDTGLPVRNVVQTKKRTFQEHV